MADRYLPEASPAELKRLHLLNDVVLVALREEAELALRLRLAAGWGEVSREINEAAGALRKRMSAGDSFDISLAWFVAKHLDQLAAEIRANLNLRETPQWPN